jgi:hypothetical protein
MKKMFLGLSFFLFVVDSTVGMLKTDVTRWPLPRFGSSFESTSPKQGSDLSHRTNGATKQTMQQTTKKPFSRGVFSDASQGYEPESKDSHLSTSSSVMGVDVKRIERPTSALSSSKPMVYISQILHAPVQPPMPNPLLTAAINKWSHLIPDGEVKIEINTLLLDLGSLEKKEELVELLCSHIGENYALYASTIFADIFVDTEEENDEFGRMLAHINSDRIPRQPSSYWEFHQKGYYRSE